MMNVTERPVALFLNARAHQSARERSQNRLRGVLRIGFHFHFLLDHWAHCGIFANGVLLMHTLEGVSNVANFITAYEESY